MVKPKPKKKQITFESLEQMKTLEFMGIKWKNLDNIHACETEFAWRNFILHFFYFGGDEDSIRVDLVMKYKVSGKEVNGDVSEAWGKTVKSALRDLETSIRKIAVLTRYK